jgi:glycosyltransferase involved in cell wall biosynthesis
LKQNIAIITKSLLSGGAEKQSVYLAKVLSREHTVSFVVLKGDNIEVKYLQIIKNERINIILLKSNYVRKIHEVYKIFVNRNINFCFSYLASGNFFNGVIGKIAGVKHRIGGIRNAKLPRQKLLFERILHNTFLTATISNSYTAVEGLSVLNFNKSKFHVIHNAFELEMDNLIKSENNIINILSVARFVPQKDYFTAIEAINILKNEFNNNIKKFNYLLIGYGELENEIRTKVKELKLLDVIQIIIKPDNLKSYFRKADIFLTTSLYEGMSNSVMEALSFSLPIVATPAGDMEYLVKENKNGYICKIGNAKQMADKLKYLIEKQDVRKKMSEESFKIISKEFTLETFKNHYIDFINKSVNI